MIVAGFGFRKDATLASIEAALTLAQQALPPIAMLAAPEEKVPRLLPLAEAMDLPLVAVPAAALMAARTQTVSPVSLRVRGTGSVAEAAALAAAGPRARLLCTRRVSPDRMATCAIATGTPPTGIPR